MTKERESEILLRTYTDFAAFLVRALGPRCSVVIYDVDDSGTDGKVVAVSGDDTSHKMGDTMTLFVKHVLLSIREKHLTELMHVDTEASTIEGRVKLSIYPIREKNGALIGLFIICIGIDLLYDIREAVNQILGFDNREESSLKMMKVIDENLSLSKYMQQLIREEIESFSVPVNRMTMEEKKQIVQRLEKLEVFYVKDSVKVTASLLGISIPTVYRLLKRE